jgi:pimeloyl-[acyl-carrier protein] methyl ester esterase
MSLYTQTIGDGPDIVLLHGWGLNSAVWKETVTLLSPYYRLTLIDLPGHGRSPLSPPFTLASITQQVAEIAPPRAAWLGWSLGGMVALNVALHQPARVTCLILTASNAQFVRSDDWPYGMDPTVMRQFADNLEKDYKATVNRFLALQTLGQTHARETLKTLKERMAIQGEPNVEALRGGMDILLHESAVQRLGEVHCPVLLALGRRDALVPVSAGEAMLAKLQNGKLHVFEQSAHAPFLSHTEAFAEVVKNFLMDIICEN